MRCSQPVKITLLASISSQFTDRHYLPNHFCCADCNLAKTIGNGCSTKEVYGIKYSLYSVFKVAFQNLVAGVEFYVLLSS